MLSTTASQDVGTIDQLLRGSYKNLQSQKEDDTSDKVKLVACNTFEKPYIPPLVICEAVDDISYLNEYNPKERIAYIKFSVRKKINTQDFEGAIKLIQSTLHPSYMRLDPDLVGVENDFATKLLVEIFQEWFNWQGIVYVTIKAEEMSEESEGEMDFLPYDLGDIAKMAVVFDYIEQAYTDSDPELVPDIALAYTNKMNESVFKDVALLKIAHYYLDTKNIFSSVDVIKQAASVYYQYEIYKYLEDETKTSHLDTFDRLAVMDDVYQGLSLYYLPNNYPKAQDMSKKIFSRDKKQVVIDRLTKRDCLDEYEDLGATDKPLKEGYHDVQSEKSQVEEDSFQLVDIHSRE